MKIGELNRGIQRPVPSAPMADAPVASSQRSAFLDVMQGINRSNATEVLTRMSQDIVKQGEILAQRYDIAELKRYKRMLTEFLSEAVRYSYEFNKRQTRDGRGRHHVYAIVKRINEKLEKITQDILREQVEQIQLIADINDIHGMLVDLLA